MRATTLYITKWLLIWLNIAFFVINIYVTIQMFQRTDDHFREQLRQFQPNTSTTTTLLSVTTSLVDPKRADPATRPPSGAPTRPTTTSSTTTTTTTTTQAPTTLDINTYRRRRNASEPFPTDQDVLAEMERIKSSWHLRQCGVGLISLIVLALSLLGMVATCQGSNTLLLLYSTLLGLSLLILSLSYHNFVYHFWAYVTIISSLVFTLSTSMIYISILKRSPATIRKRILATYRPSVSI